MQSLLLWILHLKAGHTQLLQFKALESQPLFVLRINCLLSVYHWDYPMPYFSIYYIFRGKLFLANFISWFTQTTERDKPRLICSRFLCPIFLSFGILVCITRYRKYWTPLTPGPLPILLTPQKNSFNGNNCQYAFGLSDSEHHTQIRSVSTVSIYSKY